MYKNLPGRPGVVLAAAAVAQFVFALDMSVVNVALPAIRTALGFAPLDLSWIVHIYALAFGGLLLLGGRACDLYGHRRLFVGGLTFFGLCSLAGGLAQEPWQLIAARAGQGVGAAAAAPAALGMLTTTFAEGPRRVRALGVWSAVNAAGGALGLLAGGLLTEYAGWRWVMLVNVPVVAAALALVPAGVPAGRPDRRERLDVLGAVLATGGIGLLVFGVVRTETRGWGSPATVATLATAAALLAAFLLAESKAPAPLLRLGLLRSRWVAGANMLVFLAAAGQFTAFYFLSLYMQQVLGMGAAATGTAFLPFSVSLVAGTVLATRVTAARTPRAALVPGASLAAAGLAWCSFISPGGGFVTDVLGPSVVIGVGVGLVLAPVAAAATTGVTSREAGMASGLFNSSRQLGGCVGLAALATVAALRTGPATDPTALNDGYALGLAVTAGLFVLAAVVAIGVLPHRRTGTPDPQPAAPAENRLEETPS
ncbi:MFS transporter [Streptomyces capillispiralis]|uniref:EmrB/QacA subfamily drug resistance transporter n=1 Tax=Streptomyces capillispiralis TaxID=68182 RepID=A0A561TJ64_9ACTN|nr:MFS transporter [Streptomyces capillispiralis]TWF87132.1 EmrB/QacA subfamily drug resistance transporter [Streptomyces capillispiralis]GHH95936.1 MFS transporter [Streptomyces capillispiralis]